MKTGNILQFPTRARRRFGFQAVKSTYTVREISQLFGLSERRIRRWAREGLVQATSIDGKEDRYDFRALTQFRRVRELRDQGLTIKQIESELRGQLNLFQPSGGQLSALPTRLSAFERALLLHERGSREAADQYRRAIRAKDCVADAYCNLGILEFEAGSAPRAFDCFSKSLHNDERHFESHFNLGNLYFDAGDLRLARLHYELAAELEPSFSHTYFNLALVHALCESWQAARRSLLKYKELAVHEEGNLLNGLLEALTRLARTTKA